MTNKRDEYIYWIKDWWGEGMPYGINGLIRKLNKLKYGKRVTKVTKTIRKTL